MIYDTAFFDSMQCSREEKSGTITLIGSLYSISEKTRKTGLLSIEDDLPTIDDRIVRKGLQLVVDGTDPEIVRTILRIMIGSLSLRGVSLLNAAIAFEGVISIQAGDNPGLIGEKLSAFLGDDFDLWESYLSSRKDDSDGCIDADCETVGKADASVGSIDFEKLADFKDMSVQKILREVESQDLCRALKGSSEKVKKRIFSNLSHRSVRLMKDDIMYMGPVRLEDILSSQKKILSAAIKLAAAGEIIIPDGKEIVE